MPAPALPVLAVVQLAARTSLSPAEFEHLLAAKARQARERGAELVLFPAYLGLTLLAGGWSFDSLGPALAGTGAVRQAYLDGAARVARAEGVYLAPGSLIEAEPAGLVHAGYLFSPAGEILARRLQVHVSPAERRWGLVGGDAIDPVRTPWGKAGFLLGTDARYPETARILTLQGAALLLSPAAHPVAAGPWPQIAGLWREAQANQVHAAEACLTGELGGRVFGGHSAVYGPNEATPGESGVLARSGPEEDILVVRVDPRWEEKIVRYRVLELMEAGVYARQLPPAYARRGRGEGP